MKEVQLVTLHDPFSYEHNSEGERKTEKVREEERPYMRGEEKRSGEERRGEERRGGSSSSDPLNSETDSS